MRTCALTNQPPREPSQMAKRACSSCHRALLPFGIGGPEGAAVPRTSCRLELEAPPRCADGGGGGGTVAGGAMLPALAGGGGGGTGGRFTATERAPDGFAATEGAAGAGLA